MAYASSDRTATTTLSFGERIAEIRKEMIAAWRANRVYRETLRELRGLSARELDDLGLSACTLRAVALEAAYGKRS